MDEDCGRLQKLESMQHDWSQLPVPILCKIISSLKDVSISDFISVKQVCRCWRSASLNPDTWRHLVISIDANTAEPDGRVLGISKSFLRHVQSLTLKVDQSELKNRAMAIQCLEMFAQRCSVRKQHRLKVCFTQQNPLFYAGQEFVDVLIEVFGAKSFDRVDLHQLHVKLCDDMLKPMYLASSATLTFLDIQNKQLICYVTRDCMLHVVLACRSLADLRICFVSCSNLMLQALSEDNRARLRHLSLLSRRQEKYEYCALTDQCWFQFRSRNPAAKVTLKFDASCIVERMREIMRASIPVSHLYLECYSTPLDLLNASDFYAHTLTKLVLQMQYNQDFDVLLDLAKKCSSLRSLHVMTVVPLEIVKQVYELRPDLLESVRNGKSTLKSWPEPHPWVSDDELDSIIL